MVANHYPLVPLLHQDVGPAAGVGLLLPLRILVDNDVVVVNVSDIPEDPNPYGFDVGENGFGNLEIILHELLDSGSMAEGATVRVRAKVSLAFANVNPIKMGCHCGRIHHNRSAFQSD